MDFFASWYPGDLWVPDYDPNCRMLISTSSVSQYWRLDRYKNLPITLIIDSGGFRYASRPDKRLFPQEVLTKQISMIRGQDLKIFLCALDHPIFDPALSSNEKDRRISQTIAYAYEMKAQFEKLSLDSNIQPMAIVQGYDVASLKFCAHELKSIGFSWYGLGSLLAVKQNESALIQRVEAVIDQVGTNLHIFGISSISTIRKLRQLGVTSFDSARPAKSAMYNQIFFYIRNQLTVFESHGDSNLHIPVPPEMRDFPCNCPICNGQFNYLVTIIGKRHNIALRAIHNYWHLKMAFLDQ